MDYVVFGGKIYNQNFIPTEEDIQEMQIKMENFILKQMKLKSLGMCNFEKMMLIEINRN